MNRIRAQRHRGVLCALISTSALLITGCAVGPDYARPTLESPKPPGAVAAPCPPAKSRKSWPTSPGGRN
jgi:hypothetical protein